MKNFTVKLIAEGNPGSGKTTVLEIAREALRKAGYGVTEIKRFGDEWVIEVMEVTTAIEKTEVIWLNNQKQKSKKN
jgi:nucleoside-triphosphatase THEP1